MGVGYEKRKWTGLFLRIYGMNWRIDGLMVAIFNSAPDILSDLRQAGLSYGLKE